MKQAYISQIEGGKQNPTLGTLMALVHAAGKDVRALLRQPSSSTKSK
jgi:transcriptional regulator with XRE-family HTH domain